MQFLSNSWSGPPCVFVRRLWVAALLCLALAHNGRAAQVLHGHVPPAVSRLAPVGQLEATHHLQLAVALPLRNQAALTTLLHQLYDPASPSYRRFLTPAQFTAQFGPTEQDYDALAAFAKAHNLTVTGRSSNRVILDLDGSVSDIENALHVKLRVYRHPTEPRTFYAPDAEPSLDLAVPVAHISGLDDFSIPKPRSMRIPIANARPSAGSGPSGLYIGNDFRAAYAPGVTLTGSGQSIALLEFDGYNLSDIQEYESQAGLPNVTCTNVVVNGSGPLGNGQFEVTLDIDAAIAMAPGVSSVIVYEVLPHDTSGNTWHDLLNRIADDDLASQISCSWYSPGESKDTVADGIFQQMATQGQTFFCASGDSDAYTGLIPFPEDDPYITLVGGTNLTDQGTGGVWSSETVWNNGGGTGSGGGISTQYTIPAWQQDVAMNTNGGSTAMRNTPDVALTATDVYVYQNGEYEAAGTSCAAPLWAGFTAMINQEALANGMKKVGFINTALYALAAGSDYSAAFHDITTGNNTSPSSPSQFYATAGYDLCSGLGTPAGQALIDALALPPSDSLFLSSTSVLSSGHVSGPFSPAGSTFIISNSGSATLAWTAAATQSWLSLSATSGTIAVSGSTSLTASINANANILPLGTYTDTITFTDVSTGYVQTRPATLTVIINPPVITSTLAATATTSVTFNYTITATNSPTSYAASGLPSGLSVNTSTGVISGKTTSTGPHNVSITASNAGSSGTATLVLTVVPPPPVISSSLAATATTGTAFSYHITATNTPTSYNATNLPAGLAVNTTSGLISGTATSTGTSNVSISASNAGGTGTASLILTVVPPPPAITSTNSATAMQGVLFTYQIAATNTPTSFNATGLPAGLAVNTSTGFISGTANSSGTSNVALSASNAGGTGTASLFLTVLPPPPAITSTNSTTVIQGAPFTYYITATNTPTSFNATGLPAGLAVNTSTGFISGTATSTGTSNITITASNAGGTGTASLFLTVLPPPPVITNTNSATATQGTLFTYYITATNSPTGFNVTGLPAGLGVDTTSGLISGTATSTGTSNIAITASNAGGTGTASLFLTVLPPAPAITSTNSATATQGTLFTYYITATNSPTGYKATGLPAGLGVDISSGLISGTATSTSTSNISITASNAGGTGTASLLLTVVPPPPAITSTNSATATQGTLFTYCITATNSPTSYNATGLPAGLGVDISSGLISGTAASTGTSNISIAASNAGGTGTASLLLTVVPPPPAITSTNTATAMQGTLFTYYITATNSPTGYNATGLPAGLGVNISSGLISGTATSTSTSNIALSASNAGGTGTSSLLLTILPPPPVITSTTPVIATVGASFNFQITATNSPASYAASGLPSGLILDAATGLITGTATATGTSNVTISAINLGGTGSATLTLPVVTPYSTWQSSVFTAAQLDDPTVSGDSADPAGDGIPNLLKYALDLNPFIVGDCGLPVSSIVTTGSGNYLTLTYTQVLSATDITYTVQVSTDLQNWNSGPGYTDPPVISGSSDGVTQLYNVQAAQPVGTTPGQFIRLQVTGP